VAQGKFININYPFKDSDEGFFLDLTKTDSAAIKADLMHLILTRKGQRLYMPDFGTDLMLYIFEPSDSKTFSEIKLDLKETVKKYIPNLTIDEVIVEQDPNSEHRATIRIDYNISEDVFTEQDFVIINL
tara:strand:+ start:17908 stop:18294 length:387 start_codon:yes stop_codon:yes gene_type:complete